VKLRRLRIVYTVLESSSEAELLFEWRDRDVRLERTWSKYVIRMGAEAPKECRAVSHSVISLPLKLGAKLSALIWVIVSEEPSALRDNEAILDGVDFIVQCETDDGRSFEKAFSNPSRLWNDAGARLEKLVRSISYDSEWKLNWLAPLMG